MKEHNPQLTQGYNQTQTKEVPVGAKIISVLYYISFSFSIFLIIGVFWIIIRNRMVIGIGLIWPILILLVSIGFAILLFFMGKGLWKGENWARMTAIVFSIIYILGYILIIVFGSIIFAVVGFSFSQLLGAGGVSVLIGIAIQALIAGYLLFNKKVKEAFKKS